MRFKIGYDPATGKVGHVIAMNDREPEVEGLDYISVNEYPEFDATVNIPDGMGPVLCVENGKLVTKTEPLVWVDLSEQTSEPTRKYRKDKDKRNPRPRP